jgi:hypothetical protein
MFTTFLKKISRNNVFFLKPIKKNNILQNPVIFWYWKIKDLKEHKYIYVWNLYKQKVKLEKILKSIKKNREELWEKYYKILVKEIKFIYKKIDFLKNIYDFEANKIDHKYEISYPEFDYDYYNKKFFWVTSKNISEDINILPLEDNKDTLTKIQLIELLDYSVLNVPWLKYKFWSFIFMSHSSGTLCIPNKKIYTLREVITLFFHEMTHFFRRYNSIRNFWTFYWFSDYLKIEEWFALYNEYMYWRKLIAWLKYNPYYDACYNILLNKELTEKEKKDKIIYILWVKWFTKEKSLNYYYRFYRFSKIGSNKFFLKDLIYTKWYKKVRSMIKINPYVYDYIFSWRIWISAIKENICEVRNNFDTKSYFSSILLEIKKRI